MIKHFCRPGTVQGRDLEVDVFTLFLLNMSKKLNEEIMMQCPLLNRITLGQRKSDNNKRMIQLTDVFCVLLQYNGTSNI